MLLDQGAGGALKGEYEFSRWAGVGRACLPEHTGQGPRAAKCTARSGTAG